MENFEFEELSAGSATEIDSDQSKISDRPTVTFTFTLSEGLREDIED